MEEERLVRGHRVLVAPELGQAMCGEVLQPVPRALLGDRQPERGRISRGVGEALGHLRDRGSGDLIVRGLGEWRNADAGAGKRLAVVCVEVPPLPGGSRSVHQDAGAPALPPIEVLHARSGMGGEPLVDLARGSEEQTVGIHARLEPLLTAETLQPFVDAAVGRTHPGEAVDVVRPDEAPQTRDEAEPLGERDPLDACARPLQAVGRVAHRRQQQHDLVGVVRATAEGGIRFDHQDEVDLGIVEGRVVLELLRGEDDRSLHARHDAIAQVHCGP